jgi:hypothetical protein
MNSRSVPDAARRPSWLGTVVVDWTRVTVLLGTIALLVLFADARLTREPLAWLALAQYGLVIALGAAAFSLVPRPVRRTTPGYTGACAVAGAVAVLTLAWLIQIDLSALAAPSVAAAERLGDVPLRSLASPAVRATAPTFLGEIATAARVVSPVVLLLWAVVGGAGGAAFGWATRALR